MNAKSAAASVASALALALAGCGGGSAADRPPAGAATRLVPADALVYVHLSIDKDRAATARARKLADRFPGYAAVRDSILKRLSAPGCRIAVGGIDGKEAALALLNGAGTTAGSLVLLDTGAQQSGARQKDCGTLRIRYIGRFLAIGQPQSIRAAVALAAGHGRSLAANRDYVRATSQLPPGRVADAWASRDGVRRLLAPQGGLLGAAGALLDQRGLRGTALGLTAAEGGATLSVRNVLDPQARGRPDFAPFKPTLQAAVPDGAMAYLGVSGLAAALRRIIVAAGPSAASLAPLIQRLSEPLSLFTGEVGVALTAAIPAPILTLVTHLGSGTGARSALRAFKRLAPGLRLSSAVFDGKLVVSTKAAGVAQARAARHHMPDSSAFNAVLGDVPARVTSLVFLDFTQLLQLGEQTGLSDSSAYLAVKDDLQKVRAVGAYSTTGRGESTAEIILSIP